MIITIVIYVLPHCLPWIFPGFAVGLPWVCPLGLPKRYKLYLWNIPHNPIYLVTMVVIDHYHYEDTIRKERFGIWVMWFPASLATHEYNSLPLIC